MDEMLILIKGLTVGEVTTRLATMCRWLQEEKYGKPDEEIGAETFCEDFEEAFSDV